MEVTCSLGKDVANLINDSLPNDFPKKHLVYDATVGLKLNKDVKIRVQRILNKKSSPETILGVIMEVYRPSRPVERINNGTTTTYKMYLKAPPVMAPSEFKDLSIRITPNESIIDRLTEPPKLSINYEPADEKDIEYLSYEFTKTFEEILIIWLNKRPSKQDK
jgi:hypothetical protein